MTKPQSLNNLLKCDNIVTTDPQIISNKFCTLVVWGILLLRLSLPQYKKSIITYLTRIQ